MKYLPAVFILLAACSPPADSPDMSAADVANSSDVGPAPGVDAATDSGSASDSGAADSGASVDAGDTPDQSASDSGAVDMSAATCHITVEVQTGIALADTQDEPVTASNPTICWELVDGATAPGAGGWHVRVEREENAGGAMTEWVAQGIPSELRRVTFGDCAGEATCTTPTTLMPGSHFVSVWDEDEPARIGGSTVVQVQ